jgi:hypothetical protein
MRAFILCINKLNQIFGGLMKKIITIALLSIFSLSVYANRVLKEGTPPAPTDTNAPIAASASTISAEKLGFTYKGEEYKFETQKALSEKLKSIKDAKGYVASDLILAE